MLATTFTNFLHTLHLLHLISSTMADCDVETIFHIVAWLVHIR